MCVDTYTIAAPFILVVGLILNNVTAFQPAKPKPR